MLSTITVNQALPLALKLAESGKVLRPLEDSPLHQILQTCVTSGLYVEGTDLDGLSTGQVAEALIESANHKDASGHNEHNGVVGNYVSLAGQSVAQTLNFTRNIVLPQIKTFLEKLENYRAGLATLNATPYVITQVKREALYSNPLLAELVERFSNTPAVDVPQRSLPPHDVSSLQEIIRTGAAEFDAEVSAALGEAGFIRMVEILAGQSPLEGCPPIVALGIHLAGKALYGNPPEGAELGLTDYNSHMSLLTEQSGRMVYQHLEELARRDRLGFLYVGGAVYHPNQPVEIVVDSAVYLRMLEQGLTPEALMGNEILGRSYSQAQLVEHVPILTQAYNREINLRNLRLQMEIGNKMREGILSLVATEITAFPEEDLPLGRPEMQTRATEYVSNLSDNHLNNLPLLVRNLICHVFYAHTDARLILEKMDALGETRADMDPRELALLTTIQYVAYWVSKQIKVS